MYKDPRGRDIVEKRFYDTISQSFIFKILRVVRIDCYVSLIKIIYYGKSHVLLKSFISWTNPKV